MLLVVVSLLTAAHISAIFISLIFAPRCVEVVDRMICCVKYSHFLKSMICVSLASMSPSDAGVLPSDKTETPFINAYGLGTITVRSTRLHNPLDPKTFYILRE